MPHIAPVTVTDRSTALGLPEERVETSAQPQPRASSRLPSANHLMAFIGMGGRPRQGDTPPGTPRSMPQPAPTMTRRNALGSPNDTDRPGLPPAASPRLTRSLAQRETPFPQQMQAWARACENDPENWQSDWIAEIAGINGIERNPRVALQKVAAILTSVERSQNPKLKLQFSPFPRFPADISCLAHLQEVIIESAGLHALPESIDALRNLRTLNLGNNPLQALPASLAGLTQLRRLEVFGSPLLTELPDNLVSRDAAGELQGMVNLETLKMIRTGLTTLPPCVTRMGQLTELNLDRAPLRTLPGDIDRLTQLQTLSLPGTSITELPPSLGALARLTELNLRGCTQLRTLPENIGDLQALRHLDLRGCGELETLPASIGRLPPGCDIQVPPQLQGRLNTLRLRTPVSQADAVSAALNAQTKRIDAAGHWMLDQVWEQAKNPFVLGSPGLQPDPSTGNQRMTLGEVPALKTMLEESQNLDARNALEYGSSMQHFTANEPLNVHNLSAAVKMWRAREMAIAQNPFIVNRFPQLAVDLPEELQIRTAPQPPVATNASGAGAPPAHARSQ